MEYESLRETLGHAARKLIESWRVKSLLGSVLGILQFHAELLGLFVLLVVIDLFTKFIALSYLYLTEYNVKNPGIAQCIVAMRAAHRARYIKSYVMKSRFIGKIIVYLLIVVTSGTVDRMLELMKHPGIFLPLCVGYLAATELLSCVENLNDANVSIAAGLIKKVKEKV